MTHLRTETNWKTVLWSFKSVFVILYWNYGHCILCFVEGGCHPACLKKKTVEKPASWMVRDAEVQMAMVVYTSPVVTSNAFSVKTLHFLASQCQTTFNMCYNNNTTHLWWKSWQWPASRTDLSHKCVAYHVMKKCDKWDLDCQAAEIPCEATLDKM